MSRIEHPEDWEWTDDEHLAIWLSEILSTPPSESRVRELCVAFRDPEKWGRAIRTLGYPRERLRGVQGPLTAYDWDEEGTA